MKKTVKTAFISFLFLILISSVYASDTPDMIDIDVTGTILQQYKLSTTEVTQQLYQAVTGRNPSSCVSGKTAFSKMLAGEEQTQRPVETVTFFDAMMFCNLLTEQELGASQCVYTLKGPVYDIDGHIIRFDTVKADFSKTGYRLPTDEEWQNAAGLYPASGAMYAWEFDNAGARGEGRSGYGTHAVAKKMPDSTGLYDMGGNVAEMCHEGETLRLCIMGSSWNKTDEYYTDGYEVDYLHGYTQYTVSRNHVREVFPGYSTCGFRLCQSVADLPFTLASISVPDFTDTYEGLLPVHISGSGFLSRRTEPLTVTVEGFATETAGLPVWLSDTAGYIPVKVTALRLDSSQQATLRVTVSTSLQKADVSGTVTRVHTEFPVHPADVLLDDGSVVTYEENRAFSGYESEHAAAVVIYAPYGGTEILSLGLKEYKTAFEKEPLDAFLAAYGEKAGIFGSYFGSGWHIPSSDEVACLSDASVLAKVNDVLNALNAGSAKELLTTDGNGTGRIVPVKNIDTRALISQKYEYLSAQNLLKEAAEKEIAEKETPAAQTVQATETQTAVKNSVEAVPEQTVLPAVEESTAAEQNTAVTAVENPDELALSDETDGEDAASEEGQDKKSRKKKEKKEKQPKEKSERKGLSEANESRTLIGFGFDPLKVKESKQTVSAELSASLFFPFLYLSAEGSVSAGLTDITMPIGSTGYSITAKGLSFTSWEAAASLGVSVRLGLGAFHPDLFVSGGVMTNQALLKSSQYVRVRLEAGADIPIVKRVALTGRYIADLEPSGKQILLTNYRLTAGISITFPDFVLF